MCCPVCCNFIPDSENSCGAYVSGYGGQLRPQREKCTWTNVVLLAGTEGTGRRAAYVPAQWLPTRFSLPGAHAHGLHHHVPPFRCGGMSSDHRGGVTKAMRLPDPLEVHFLIGKL